MYPDLLFHYGTDLTRVVAGEGPAPSLVLLQVQRLPDTSMTHALHRGGPEHLGWGMDRHLAAATFDALNLNTRATGNWEKKPPDFSAWPRPGDAMRDTEKKKPVTVAELYQRFAGR